MYYLQSRYYNPEWGRFINADALGGSVGELLSHNIFAYCKNNPVNLSDPSGYLADFCYDDGNRADGTVGDFVGGIATAAFLTLGTLDVLATIPLGIAYYFGNYSENVVEKESIPQVLKNKAQGDAYEKKVGQTISQTQRDVVKQITVKTQSGIRTKLDFVGTDNRTNAIKLTEAKSSATAPFTPNQRLAFPEIEKTGAVVLGKGKPPYVGGTQIPPTVVDIFRQN